MQLTIDSSQRLDDVLRVVGALYDVQLAVATGDEVDGGSAAQRSSGRSGRRGRSSGRSNPGRRARADAPLTSDVRAWAQAQGHPVSDRGRIPEKIIAEYVASR